MAHGVAQAKRVSGQAGITNADWYRVGGGDGFYAQADPTDYNTVYSESQGGAMNRLDLRTGRSVSIRPRGTPQRIAADVAVEGGGGGRCTRVCFTCSITGSLARGDA